MRKRVAFLGLATLALAGAIAARATPPPQIVDYPLIVGNDLPRLLSDFDFFVDARAQAPNIGVVPYRLNMPLFSDGADKLRFVYLPPDGKAVASNPDEVLDLPVGSALIKTFAFGEGKQRRLIETRVLLHRADGWLALPYKWNAEQTEARLALAGARLPLTTPSGEEISYRIPNKNQCKECHGVDDAVVPIGPKARNLSKAFLGDMVASGTLDAVPAQAGSIPLWEDRKTADVTASARGYLDVNCAHCHRPGATASNSGLDLRWEQQDRMAIGVMKRPVAAGRGSGGFDFDVVPGRPQESILLHRMRVNEPGVAMPELGKATVDAEGVALIERWILEIGP
ncbi:SO2930 family diheme c-type cytochrome [Parerythrobacter jejuensis]|uniref:Cytochrome c domain-containing protein n=1 Tax=Parerythrobacter jejuensis TaxID=795812 RepID=A0A845AQT4_9SPHN|nr:SO2930 family diheme c-type cytochrome [Parerythrobacter jejuensis]MXP31757.1 hypothetical protein [Parerythrobacter jejuensis]